MISGGSNLVLMMQSRIKEISCSNQEFRRIIIREFATVREERRAAHTSKSKDGAHARRTICGRRSAHMLGKSFSCTDSRMFRPRQASNLKVFLFPKQDWIKQESKFSFLSWGILKRKVTPSLNTFLNGMISWTKCPQRKLNPK